MFCIGLVCVFAFFFLEACVGGKLQSCLWSGMVDAAREAAIKTCEVTACVVALPLHLCVVIVHFIDSGWNLSDELDVLNPGEFVEPPEEVDDEAPMQPLDDTSTMDWNVASFESCCTAQARSLSSAVRFLSCGRVRRIFPVHRHHF